jgi:hypothetical protein
MNGRLFLALKYLIVAREMSHVNRSCRVGKPDMTRVTRDALGQA